MSRTLVYTIYFFINIAVALSCYFYPISRDDFFQLDAGGKNIITVFVNSYLYVNPRIGQVFCNWVSRDLLRKTIFGVLLYNAFFWAIFLNVYRRRPKFNLTKDVERLIVIMAFFIVMINYFGEMFFYVPYSTNYTLTHVFYLIFLFVITEYFIFNRNTLNRKYAVPIILFLGIFTGMGNEHIPPVLLLISTILGIIYLYQKRQWPDFRIILFNLFVFIGYLILMLAPGYKNKMHKIGKEEYVFNLKIYLNGFIEIAKQFYYYNMVLVIFSLISGALLIFYWKKFSKKMQYSIGVYLLTAVLCIPIVAYSPVIAPRLLFFTNCLFIVVMLVVFKTIIPENIKKPIWILASIYLFFIGLVSIFITKKSSENYNSIMSQIQEQARTSNVVVLDQAFLYGIDSPKRLNRLILLENGVDYIDEDPTKDTSVEMNLKSHFHLKSLSVKQKPKP